MKLQRQAKQIIAVGGGKGGVGKSIVSTALACAWAASGKRVVLLDLDLGAGNLHSYLGITQRTPTIADFISRKVPDLSSLLVPTKQDNLLLCSGAEFVPGMANPPHWMKQKLLRHIAAIEADVVVLDLGAGVSFNTLDFFDAADTGLIVTAPEPAAVMNAYGFVKAALYRKLQAVFRHHPELGPPLEADLKRPEAEREFSVEWLQAQAQMLAPDAVDMMREVAGSFRPGLVVNRHLGSAQEPVIRNLLMLCQKKLGVPMNALGNLPEVSQIRQYLLNIPGLLKAPAGAEFAVAMQTLQRQLQPAVVPTKADYSDEEIDQLIAMLDELEDSRFANTKRDAWKLRVYFKPNEVVSFLHQQGAPTSQWIP